MSTYGIMKSRIAREIDRADLSVEIAEAIQTSIAHYAKDRFWFNYGRKSTFLTVAGQRSYGVADDADIASMRRIDDVLQTQQSCIRILRRVEPIDIDLMYDGSLSPNKPSCWAWIENQIHFYPLPDGAYSTRLVGLYNLAPLSADNDTNAWMVEGEHLIRSCAKKHVAGHVMRDPDLAGSMGVAETMALEALVTETHKRTPRGKIQGTQF
jgi:hypothetical protein